VLTFLAFLGCTVLFGAVIGFAATPLVNQFLLWRQVRAVRREARRLGRERVLEAFERRRATPGATCATPDPVLDQLRDAAARNADKLAPLLGPGLTVAFLVAGAAVSAWIFYL
jgi:hypothetical protein